jgi:iron complex outermembrane receptor protein
LPNGQALKTDTVRWGTGYTLGTGTSNNGASYLIKGQPLGAFFLYQHAGVDDQGNQILRDVNGNGIIDDGDRSADRVMAGQPLPKFSYAFTPTVRYKNFDLSFVLRGAYGHKVYNSRRASLSTLSQFGLRNSIKEALDYGIETMPNVSDFWLEDGGFTRLENLTIGYKIPVGESKYVSSARISVTTNNLFVITKYKGIDPEQRLDGSGGFGIDGGIYPRTRNFAIGVNVNFK